MPNYFPSMNPWQQLAAIGQTLGQSLSGAMYEQPRLKYELAQRDNALKQQQWYQQQQLQKDAELMAMRQRENEIQNQRLGERAALENQIGQADLALKQRRLNLADVAQRLTAGAIGQQQELAQVPMKRIDFTDTQPYIGQSVAEQSAGPSIRALEGMAQNTQAQLNALPLVDAALGGRLSSYDIAQQREKSMEQTQQERLGLSQQKLDWEKQKTADQIKRQVDHDAMVRDYHNAVDEREKRKIAFQIASKIADMFAIDAFNATEPEKAALREQYQKWRQLASEPALPKKSGVGRFKILEVK